jgi:hypothetical protein
MSIENAVVGSESETVVVKGLPRSRNTSTAFVKTWQTLKGDADAVAVKLGITRQSAMQKSSALRKAGVPLVPVQRAVSVSNKFDLAALTALAAELAPADAAPAA